MDAFIYQADIYCGRCGQHIRDRLTSEGKAPENPENEGSYDSDVFPKGPFGNGGGEADSPQHCGECGVALENPLTVYGVRSVIEALQNHIKTGRGQPDVLDQWADQVNSDYCLESDQQAILDRYWEHRQNKGTDE